MGQQQYELEYILDAKFSNQSNRYYYLVKWVNWKLQDSTWQPEQNLEHAQQALEEFNRKIKNNQALFDWQKYQKLRSFWEDDEQQLKKTNKKPKKRGRPKKIEKQRQKEERKNREVRGRRTMKQFQKVYDQLLSDVEEISCCTNQNRQSAHKTNNSSNINAKNELNQNLNNNQNSGKIDIENNSSQLQDLDSLTVRKTFKQRSAMMESYESQGQFSDSINMKNEIVKEYEENDNGYLNQKQEKQLNSIKSKQNIFQYKYDSAGMEWEERESETSKNQIMKLNNSKRAHESIEKGRNIIQLADQFEIEDQNANEGVQFGINQESEVQVRKNRQVFIQNMNKNDDDEQQQQILRSQRGLFDDLIKNNDQINQGICPKPSSAPQKPNLKSECITGHSCPFSSSKKEQQKQTQTEEIQKYKVVGLKRINKKYMLYDVFDRDTGRKQWMGQKQMLKLCPIAGFQYLKSRMVFEVPGQYAQLFKGLPK